MCQWLEYRNYYNVLSMLYILGRVEEEIWQGIFQRFNPKSWKAGAIVLGLAGLGRSKKPDGFRIFRSSWSCFQISPCFMVRKDDTFKSLAWFGKRDVQFLQLIVKSRTPEAGYFAGLGGISVGVLQQTLKIAPFGVRDQILIIRKVLQVRIF